MLQRISGKQQLVRSLHPTFVSVRFHRSFRTNASHPALHPRFYPRHKNREVVQTNSAMLSLWLIISLLESWSWTVTAQTESFYLTLNRLTRPESSCFLNGQDRWNRSIGFEIDKIQNSMKFLVQSMPHLSICAAVVDATQWCYPVAGNSFISDLLVESIAPQQSLHLWAQVSSTGGKIRQSDAYINLDCRQVEGDFALDRAVVGLGVYFEVAVLQSCKEVDSGTHRPQMLYFPTHKFDHPEIVCESASRTAFQQTMTSVLSLQRHTDGFCSQHALTEENCAHFSLQLQQHLRRILQSQQLQLPPVQSSPTSANPFFFMHVDKTAGSTMRMFMDESVPDPASAFIACHGGVPCATFGAPRHLPSGLTLHVDLSADIDGGQLTDLRLLQPLPRDNSNLSVIAGHFDLFAPYESLPQCGAAAGSVWTRIQTDADPDAQAPRVLPVPTPECRVSCFTMGRHPVSRAISFYYQRVYQRPGKSKLPLSDSEEAAPFGGRPMEQRFFNELTPEYVSHMVLSVRDVATTAEGAVVFIDEGMSDAFCRALLGMKRTTGLLSNLVKETPLPIPPELYPQALQNLQQCVVGMQERWNDTLRVLDHWYPWIDFSVDPQRRIYHFNSQFETRQTLRPELVKIVEDANPCDMMIYSEITRLFEAQLSVLDA